MNDDPSEGIAIMIEYLYTLELPPLVGLTQAKDVYFLGDKYELPKLRDHAASCYSDCLAIICKPHVYSENASKEWMLSIVEDLWMWTIPGTDKLKQVVLDCLCQSASKVIEDEVFQDFFSRNKDFEMAFMRALAKNQAKPAPEPTPKPLPSASMLRDPMLLTAPGITPGAGSTSSLSLSSAQADPTNLCIAYNPICGYSYMYGNYVQSRPPSHTS